MGIKMRKLTQQEIDQAPEWANFYSIQKDKPYFTEERPHGLYYEIFPRKEFDISDCKYLKFKHLTIWSHPSLPSSMLTIGHNRFDAICLDKNQAIEIAKLLGATAEDLK